MAKKPETNAAAEKAAAAAQTAADKAAAAAQTAADKAAAAAKQAADAAAKAAAAAGTPPTAEIPQPTTAPLAGHQGLPHVAAAGESKGNWWREHLATTVAAVALLSLVIGLGGGFALGHFTKDDDRGSYSKRYDKSWKKKHKKDGYGRYSPYGTDDDDDDDFGWGPRRGPGGSDGDWGGPYWNRRGPGNGYDGGSRPTLPLPGQPTPGQQAPSWQRPGGGQPA
ncbi:MAG: hypothetical protein QM728_10730 [Gordonia sp. (in: high G+C Gram-positive bacteria)]|uniref:hypothetical protein n=1 Tax=Gordonia sp. (in: high G+C Gram-positive bacteria) TaxID=84139 RepID=UPI0039E6B3D4